LATDIAAIAAEADDRFQETFVTAPVSTAVSADVRYVGQSHELEVEAARAWDELRSRFEAAHRDSFGFRRPGEPIEVVNLRAVANGESPVSWSDLPQVSADVEPEARDGVWQRQSLPRGFALDGPGVVVETNSAVLLERGDRLTVMDDGTLEIVSR
jgi:N-methylhydantoinase A